MNVLFFPVRHHSPACARHIAGIIRERQPRTVLIEGPYDFNDKIAELNLPHRLPIAIYSYVITAGGQRRGAYYPFCIYSPEYQALKAAFEIGATVRFIDLPWADQVHESAPAHRYSDADWRSSAYVQRLCEELGVEGLDALWDTLFEIEDLSADDFVARCLDFCSHLRTFEDDERASAEAPDHRNAQREAFMAGEVRRAVNEGSGDVVVVLGGFHVRAVADLVEQGRFDAVTPSQAELGEGRGIALSPYSYQVLDSLSGYNAGMPNPGFYHQLFLDRLEKRSDTWRVLVANIVADLRRRGQMISAADLIALETTARGLAAVRGRREVWRSDLVDAVTSALVKDEIQLGVSHPVLAALAEALRGGERGRLAEGTSLPPLVLEVRRRWKELDLRPRQEARECRLDLLADEDLERSRFLHALRILAIPGFDRRRGPDLAAGKSPESEVELTETWRLRWRPELEGALVEAAAYGPTVREAVAARVLERSAGAERDAALAAGLLVDAALAGVEQLSGTFYRRVEELIRTEADFVAATGALAHLLYLYRYNPLFKTAGREDVGDLLAVAVERSLVVLEGLGHPEDPDGVVRGVGVLLESHERLDFLPRETFAEVLERVAADNRQLPMVRGAALGALWTLGEAQTNEVLSGIDFFGVPEHLGDFLTGLLRLARQVAKQSPELLAAIDRVVMAFDADDFLTALPGLRLAFAALTPREKHHLVEKLFTDLGEEAPRLDVAVAENAAMLALEAELERSLKLYGIRRPGESL